MAAEQLLVGEVDSFARFTITTRLPRIVREVARDGAEHLSATQLAALEQLAASLSTPEQTQIDPALQLHSASSIELARWRAVLHGAASAAWSTLSFFEAETYFYRLLLEIVEYHTTAIDPFRVSKDQSVTVTLASISSLYSFTHAATRQQQHSTTLRDTIATLLYCSLWGNRVDLSLFAAADDRSSESIHAVSQLQRFLLADDTEAIVERVLDERTRRIDVVLDNYGYELACDLALVEYLLATGTVELVVLHAKARPTFVSDTTQQADIERLLHELQHASGVEPACRELASTLTRRLSSQHGGSICVEASEFWTEPFEFEQLERPDESRLDREALEAIRSLQAEFAASHLVLLKGDLNYRRLVGDRRHASTTEFASVARFPAEHIAALRTLKSEVVVGLAERHTEEALVAEHGASWQTSGELGVVQYRARAPNSFTTNQ